MPSQTKRPPATKHTAAGERLIASAKQALAWAKGDDAPGIRVTVVGVDRTPAVDVRPLRQKLGPSQSRSAQLP